MVEKFTKISSEITKIPEQAFVVIVKENDLDNIGVGGMLLDVIIGKKALNNTLEGGT